MRNPLTLPRRIPLAFAVLALSAAGLLAGCASGRAARQEPPAAGDAAAAEAVDFTVGLLPIDGLSDVEAGRVLSEMRRADLFRAVVQAASINRNHSIDVFVTVVNNFGGLKGWDAMRPDVTAVSGHSRRTIRAWKARCGAHDRFCINGATIAAELAATLAPGGEAYASLLSEKASSEAPARADQTAAPQVRPQSPAAALISDIDGPLRARPEDPKSFALVIGIGAYKSLPEARFAVRDAESVRNHLLALGYPRRNVILLTGDNATRTGIQKYVEEWLPRNLPEGARLFFYYSGHGAPDTKTGEAYLVPWDGDPQFLQSTAYAVAHLYASLAKLKAGSVIVALDSCFSGAGGRSVLPSGARPLVTKADPGVAPAGPLTVFAAASGDEITGALDEQGHGLFTYYFLKGLSGAARDGSGAVTARGLHAFLKPRVQDEARRQNREQTPLLLGSPDAEVSKD